VSEWNEFRVTFSRSWKHASARPAKKHNPPQKEDWGLTDGIVDLQKGVREWKDDFVASIVEATVSISQSVRLGGRGDSRPGPGRLSVGPLFFDEAELSYGVGGRLSIHLKGQIVVRARNAEEAQLLLEDMRERTKLDANIEVWSDLATLAAEKEAANG
jgi:hypothetical protein